MRNLGSKFGKCGGLSSRASRPSQTARADYDLVCRPQVDKRGDMQWAVIDNSLTMPASSIPKGPVEKMGPPPKPADPFDVG